MINQNINSIFSKDIKSVWQRWVDLSIEKPNFEAIVHWTLEDMPHRWTYSALIERANFYSNQLMEAGIKPGEVCAIILRHHPEFYPLYMGIVGMGALPSVLAYPNRKLHPEKFQQGILGMSARSGLDWILTEKPLEELIKPLVSSAESTIKKLIFPLEFSQSSIPNYNSNLEKIRSSFKRETPLLLQHSSGTTGLQKPVLLSNGAVLDHIRIYGDSIALNKDDKVVSWLPLYHDMGLIATFHLPLAFGIPHVKLDPFEWILGPEILLETITNEKGTLTWMPNFALNVLSDKVHSDELENISLESLRLVINCSEPIRNTSHKKFFEKYKDYGIKHSTLSTCYAMAETTFAVTQSTPGKEIKEITVDNKSYSRGIIKQVLDGKDTRICVSSGRLIKGCEIKIVDEVRNELPNGSIGEIAVKSVSVFDGYRNYPEKTNEVLKDGWFYTGDYGFCIDGEYYVVGRRKDIIIVAGKNIYPEDIEYTVGEVDGILPGRVVAFGEDNEEIGTEQVSIIAETSIKNPKDRKNIIAEIKKQNLTLDISISNVYLVPPKWLIKSSAGKLSRNANKSRLLKERQKKTRKIKRRKSYSYIALGFAILSLIISIFFYEKALETQTLLDEFINDAIKEVTDHNTEQLALKISHKIFAETNNFIEREELDWYSELEATSFFNMTSAVGLEYNCFGIKGEPGDGPCGTMTKIFLVAMWDLDIPARKLQLAPVNDRGGHTMAEFYYNGKWRVISPSDSSFVWRHQNGEIATVEDIQRDTSIFNQVYNYKADWPYSFKYPANINWEKLPAFLPPIIKSIIGDVAYENTETPRLYEIPRTLLFMMFLFLTFLFLIVYILLYRSISKIKRKYRFNNF